MQLNTFNIFQNIKWGTNKFDPQVLSPLQF